MKKIIIVLCMILCLTFFLGSNVNASETLKETNVDLNALNTLVHSYYNDGVYTKETKINLNDDARLDLLEEGYWHAGVSLLERTTYYNVDELWMTNHLGGYSYYGTSGSDMTHAYVSSLEETSNEVVVTGKTMNEYYIGLEDIVAKDEHNWSFNEGVYTSNDKEVLEWFKAFTAPCYAGANSDYVTLTSSSIEVFAGNLVLKLHASTNNGAFVAGAGDVFSYAIILNAKPEIDIILSEEELTLAPLSSTTLYAAVAGSQADIEWSSSDENVATVDSEGNVTAIGNGTANITATIEGVSDSCVVTVASAEGYSLTPVYPSSYDQNKSYYKNGVLTIGNGAGIQTDIFDGENVASLNNYEVEMNVVLSGSVGSGSNLGLQVNKTENASKNVTSCYMIKLMTDSSMTLSKNTSVVKTADSMIFEANKLYVVRVRVENTANSAHIQVYVDDALCLDYTDTTSPLTGTIFGVRCASFKNDVVAHKFSLVSVKEVLLNESSLSLAPLETTKLIASVNGTGEEVVWSSSDDSVATVDSEGNVSAKGNGTATITATALGKTVTCEVVVETPKGYTIETVMEGSNFDSNKTFYANGVYTFGKGGPGQADIFENGEHANLSSYEIEMNMILSGTVGSGANVGYLINKTEKADGSLSTAYMVQVMTNSSIVLKKLSGSTTKETVNSLTTIKFEADKVYNVKFRVETSADSVHIEVYVDNTLYIDYTDTNSPYTGTVFGLRCGAFTNDVVAHKFSLVSINPLS